jgi:REP element-mobilizing transposase RayT
MDTQRFNGKYRIPSARWAAWDYASNAAYFVTICNTQRAPDFGVIQNGIMEYSPLGQAAEDCWNAIPEHFPFVILDEFVIMPNHVHGILIIDKPDAPAPMQTAPVETQYFASLRQQRTGNKFGPQSQNLASIVRGYKIGVTKFARLNGIPFTWQARYHDRVIRNAAEYSHISQYIQQNPQKWLQDEFHTPS